MSEGRNNLQYSDFPLFAISGFVWKMLGFCFVISYYTSKKSKFGHTIYHELSPLHEGVQEFKNVHYKFQSYFPDSTGDEFSGIFLQQQWRKYRPNYLDLGL